MRKIQILLAALVAVVMSSCVQFKTEATVDVEVTKNNQPQAGVVVWKMHYIGVGGVQFKQNYTASATTNAAGVAHFDLKSPDDFAPSSVGAQDEETFYFAVFDANEDLLGYVAQTVKTGDNLTVKLSLDEQQEQQD